MKLKATYVKLSVGRIMATITVIDKGYYIENIKKSFLTDKEAVEWVEAQTEALRDRLNLLGNAKVLDDLEYSV